MPLAWKPARLPKAHTTLQTPRGVTLRFYHSDCVEVLRAIEPGAVSAIVTSPPYNLGVSYRSYNDSLPRASYLEWSDAWIKAASRTLSPQGSLFLNVGAKPTDPWTAMEVAQTARKHLHLQNTIHWIKSIAIDQEAAGAAAGLDRDLAIGHYKPINSERFVNDCHEFVFQFTPEGRTPSTAAPSAWPTRTSRTSLDGKPAGTTSAVAATRGSFRTRRFKAATRTARTRRRSRRAWPPTASNSTACHGSVW